MIFYRPLENAGFKVGLDDLWDQRKNIKPHAGIVA
jgi:hypothetical protein